MEFADSARSRYETPRSLLTLEHYRQNGLMYGWSPGKYRDLAKRLGMSVYELGRFLGIFDIPPAGQFPGHGLVTKYLKTRFPPPAAILCAVIEGWCDEQRARRMGGAQQGSQEIFPVHIIQLTSEARIVPASEGYTHD